MPVSKYLDLQTIKKPFGRGTTPGSGDLLTMVLNDLPKWDDPPRMVPVFLPTWHGKMSKPV